MDTGRPDIMRNPAVREESRKIRRLQFLMGLTLQTIAEGNLSFEQASTLAASTRRAALTLFPGKEEVFDLIYQPRLRKVLAWRYRLQ